jgi:hypothetical protein
MSNETKRDVFDETLSNLKKMDAQIEEEWGCSQLTMGVGKHGDVESIREIAIAEIRDRYAAALPDDLPAIPKAVSEYIQERKAEYASLAFALTARFIPNEVVEWMFMVAGDPDTELSQIEYVKQQDTFARAWVLGAWRIQETGEIVKLEADD